MKKISIKNADESQRYTGFTLAEVLITLGIIGVIAALIIPNLIAKQQEKATVVALKKAYSTLSNAYTLASQENGTPDAWSIGTSWSAEGSNKISNVLMPYLNVAKYCSPSTDGCAPNTSYERLKKGVFYGNIYSDVHSRVLLNDGSTLYIIAYRQDVSDISYFGFIFVDINGIKKPNREGVDWFIFMLTNKGIVPAGTSNGNGFYSFDNDCGNFEALGEGCAAWVLYNENMDYLKCPADLSWNGNKTCP